MTKGNLREKVGMTQSSIEAKLIPVTVIEATPNVAAKTVETDGYNAILKLVSMTNAKY